MDNQTPNEPDFRPNPLQCVCGVSLRIGDSVGREKFIVDHRRCRKEYFQKHYGQEFGHHVQLLDGVIDSFILAAEEHGNLLGGMAIRGAWLAIKKRLEV